MWGSLALRRVVLTSLAFVLAVTIAVIWWLSAPGPSPDISPESLSALQAWATFLTLFATLGLLATAALAAYRAAQALMYQEERLKEAQSATQSAGVRPVPAVVSASFENDGLSVVLENLGVGPVVGFTIEVWMTYVGPERPTPRVRSDALIALAESFSDTEPMFVGRFPGLRPGAQRPEKMREGPSAEQYDATNWPGGYGVLLFDPVATNIYGEEVSGSGDLSIEPVDGD